MKASNILLVLMLSMFLTAVVASDLLLKKGFDKLDKKDQYIGYKDHSVAPFHYVQLHGKHYGITEITSGEDYEIKSNLDQKNLSWKVVNDTLKVSYDKESPQGWQFTENIFYAKPAVYIFTPKLAGLESNGIICKIKGFEDEKLNVRQRGNGILLSDNHISGLDAQFSAGATVKVNGKNRFGESKVVVKDSSTFGVDEDVFESIDLNVESGAHANLPGSLLEKL